MFVEQARASAGLQGIHVPTERRLRDEYWQLVENQTGEGLHAKSINKSMEGMGIEPLPFALIPPTLFTYEAIMGLMPWCVFYLRFFALP